MEFSRITPHPDLTAFIECYWMMYSDDPNPVMEKIIPDGFTELIFNYRDVYKSKISGIWQLQSPNLLAGQLRTYFYLQNTGTTGSIAIKLKPAALTQIFGLNMEEYLDKIVDLDTFSNTALDELQKKISVLCSIDYSKRKPAVKQVLDDFFSRMITSATENPLQIPLRLIFSTNGMVSVSEMATAAGISERQLERLFKRYIGLSPKYYARIIRFNYIFQLIQGNQSTWADIVYQSGYYDQSHFIRNFKAFTGEDPSSYFFEEKNMANFFLKK